MGGRIIVGRHPTVVRGRKPRGFPSSLKVFGHTIKILYCHKMPKNYMDCYGVCFFNEKRIYLSLDQPKDELERTLFHELCHMFLWLSGHRFKLNDEDEEALVRALEHGVLPLYKRRRV